MVFRSTLTSMKVATFLRLAQTLGILGFLGGTALSASAQLTYNGASEYKDSSGNYYKVTSQPSSVVYTGAETNRSIYSDACGYTKITLSDRNGASLPTSIAFGSTTSTVSNISNATTQQASPSIYSCKNGVVSGPNTGRTTPFKDEGGQDYNTLTIWYPPAMTGGANKLNLLKYTSNVASSLKPNTCGFVMFKPANDVRRRTTTNFNIDGTPIDMATLAVNPNPPVCNTGSLYQAGTIPAGTPAISMAGNTVFATGLTPNTINVIGFDVWESQSTRSNECGLVQLSYSPSRTPEKIKVGSTTYTVSTLTNGGYATCSTSNFTSLPVGGIIKSTGMTNYFYIKVADFNKSGYIEKSLTATRNVPTNACGFMAISSPNKANGYTATDKLVINGSSPYTVTSLPAPSKLLSCRNGNVYTSTVP
jgi:hypothetical protein